MSLLRGAVIITGSGRHNMFLMSIKTFIVAVAVRPRIGTCGNCDFNSDKDL